MEIANRLNKIAQKDKQNNPKYLINVIKSDFFYLISNYFEVPFNDIEVKIDLVDDKFEISATCKGDRLKTFKALPD